MGIWLHRQNGVSQMDGKVIGILLTVILALVFTIGYGYSVFTRSNQTGNIPSPSPEPTPTPSSSAVPTDIDSIPTPSVPEFTLQFVKETWPLYEVNPSTGEKKAIDPDFTEGKRYIEVTIKNQKVPLTSTRLMNFTNLYYKIRVKGHHETEWTETPGSRSYRYYNASDSDCTVTLLEISVNNGLRNFPSGGEVDVQVKALIGQIFRFPVITMFGEGSRYDFVGKESGWSSTQTISIP